MLKAKKGKISHFKLPHKFTGDYATKQSYAWNLLEMNIRALSYALNDLIDILNKKEGKT